MELKKYQENEILYVIRHNMRAIRSGRKYGNESIDTSLSHENISLISRGSTPKEVNTYRKELEKEIFSYNRKNLIHAISVVIQLPEDCSPEQENDFYKECLTFWSNRLPMGERCIIQAVVHKDEIVKDQAGNRISHNHLHLMYVPGVPDKKHEGYNYKLCADQLTRKSILKDLHPALQEHLDRAGIHATVYRKKEGSGQPIKLSVAQLKEFTKLTGRFIAESITAENFAEMVNLAFENEAKIEELTKEIAKKDQQLNAILKEHDELKMQYTKDLNTLHEKATETAHALEESQKENLHLKEELEVKEQKEAGTQERRFSFGPSNKENNIERSFTF